MSQRSNLLLADGECQSNKGFEFSNSPWAIAAVTATIAATSPAAATAAATTATR